MAIPDIYSGSSRLIWIDCLVTCKSYVFVDVQNPPVILLIDVGAKYSIHFATFVKCRLKHTLVETKDSNVLTEYDGSVKFELRDWSVFCCSLSILLKYVLFNLLISLERTMTPKFVIASC